MLADAIAHLSKFLSFVLRHKPETIVSTGTWN